MTGRGSRLHSRPRAQCACAERALPGLWGCPGRPRPSRRPHLQPVPGPRRRHRSLFRRGGHGAGWWLFLLRAPHRRAFGHRRKRRRDGGRGRTKPQDARAKTAGEAPETLPRGTRQAALGQEGPGPRGRLRAGRVPVTAQAASLYSYGTAQAASPRGPRHRHGAAHVTALAASPRGPRPRKVRQRAGRAPSLRQPRHRPAASPRLEPMQHSTTVDSSKNERNPETETGGLVLQRGRHAAWREGGTLGAGESARDARPRGSAETHRPSSRSRGAAWGAAGAMLVPRGPAVTQRAARAEPQWELGTCGLRRQLSHGSAAG